MKLLLCLTFITFAVNAQALIIDQPLENTAQEQRARALFLELRCQVCSGQSVADSDAIIARQLRKLVRERITSGQSDEAIRNYLAGQYGEEILFNPPTQTSFLWLAPLGFIALGSVLLIRRRKRESR